MNVPAPLSLNLFYYIEEDIQTLLMAHRSYISDQVSFAILQCRLRAYWPETRQVRTISYDEDSPRINPSQVYCDFFIALIRCNYGVA